MSKSSRFSQGFSEVVLIVRDVPAAAQFYREVVGLIPEKEADDDWAWFWAGEPGVAQRVGLHRGTLLFEEHSPNPPERRWGRVHYAFQVERERLEDAAAHVRAQGVSVYGPTYFEWMRAKSYYFYDPDGNLLEWWSPDDDPGEERGTPS